MQADLFQMITAACALVAAACAIVAAIRAGKWRESDAAKAIVTRVDRLENRADLTEQKVAAIETDLAQLPTKADLTRLEGEINKVEAIAERTERGVRRIEDFFMERKA